MGEENEKKYSKMFSILYMAGFAAGIVCTNLLFEKTGYQSSLLSIYLADAVQKETEKAGLFGELLVRRGVFFLDFGTILWSDCGGEFRWFAIESYSGFGFSGGKSYDNIFAGLRYSGNFPGNYILCAPDVFLCSGLVDFFLFCNTDESEILGKPEKRVGRLSGLFLFSFLGSRVPAFGNLAGKLC